MEPWQFVVTLLLYLSIRQKCCTASYRLTASEIMGCAFIFPSTHGHISLYQRVIIYC